MHVYGMKQQAKNWFYRGPEKPEMNEYIHHMVSQQHTDGWSAYMQMKGKHNTRGKMLSKFPGATYLEPCRLGYVNAKQGVQLPLHTRVGSAVIEGAPPVYRGIPAEETFEQAEIRRQRVARLYAPKKSEPQLLYCFCVKCNKETQHQRKSLMYPWECTPCKKGEK